MKLIKIILAGIVGAVLMFVWGGAARMFTPLGHTGIQWVSLEKEAALQAAIRDNLPAAGLYMYPGLDPADVGSFDPVKHAAYEEKYRTGPSGIVIVAPQSESAMSAMKLGKEFLTVLGASLLASLIIFWGVPYSGLFRTLGMSIALGLMSWLMISASYNIWYRFPREYIIAEGILELVAFAIAGLAFYIVGLFFVKREPKVKKSDPLDMPI